MNEAIERAAKAAYTTMVLTFSNADWVAGLMAWEYQPDKLRANWRAAIRSAVAQIREPTEKMVRLVHGLDRKTAEVMWRTYIDALIADGAPFEAGDVVRRRGGRGGPKMTVRAPGDFAVLCVWFVGSTLNERWIPEMDLEKVDE